MSAFTPSHVFASITTQQNLPKTVNQQPPNITKIDQRTGSENMFSSVGRNSDGIDRHIKVTAVGEVSLPPDRCRMSVKIHSQKDNVQDVKNSVQRRLDYILQTFQNHGVKV